MIRRFVPPSAIGTMVFVRQDGEARVVFVGPWTTAGNTYYTEGAEIL